MMQHNAPATGLLEALCIMVLLTGCTGPDQTIREPAAHLPVPTAAPAFTAVERAVLQHEPQPVATIGPGDQFDIELIGVADSKRQITVQLDGRLSYLQANDLKLAGATITEAVAMLEDALRPWYKRPTIQLALVEHRSATATILGRVSTPRLVRLRGDERITDLVAAAGGLATSRFSGSTEELADLSGAVFLRDGQRLPVDFVGLIKQGRMDHNLRIQPGDCIYIPSSLSREVYVLGAVGLPQTVGYSDSLTLIKAIAGADGFTAEAQRQRILLQRRIDGVQHCAVIDARRILTGHDPDVRLAPGDVLFIPGDTDRHPDKLGDAAWRASAAAFGAVLGNDTYEEAKP